MNIETARKFIVHFDQQFWVRIAVLMLPGAICTKIASTLNAPPAIVHATGFLLVIGMGIFVGWPWVRSRVLIDIAPELLEAPEEESVVEQGNDESEILWMPVVPCSVHQALVTELIEMCGGDASACLKLIAVECALNEDAPYATCIEQAHKRKTLEIKSQCGS